MTEQGDLLRFERIFIGSQDPASMARWLCSRLGFRDDSRPGTEVEPTLGDCRLSLHSAPGPLHIQQGPEGYYTGLAHIALRATDIHAAMKACGERGVRFIDGSMVNHNPDVWGTGMDYVNLVSDLGVGLELAERLDLPPETDANGRAVQGPGGTYLTGLEHIGIPVSNSDASIAFYESLGFPCRTSVTIHRNDGKVIRCAMVSNATVTLELYEFVGMEHAPYSAQPFEALGFSTNQAKTLEDWCERRHIRRAASGAFVIAGPDGERLVVDVQKGI